MVEIVRQTRMLYFFVLFSVVPQINAFTATLPVARQSHGSQSQITDPNTALSPRTSMPKRKESSSLHSTWSNGQAVQGYQDFLSTGKQEIELKVDTGSVFIYGNPTYDPYNNIINAFLSMGRIGQHEDIVLSSSLSSQQPQQFDENGIMPELPETLNEQSEYPIYICIPPTQLGVFLDNLSPSYMNRIDDFVFFSGGFEFGNIEDVLKERGTYKQTKSRRPFRWHIILFSKLTDWLLSIQLQQVCAGKR